MTNVSNHITLVLALGPMLTENNLAAVQDADNLVAGSSITVDLQELCLRLEKLKNAEETSPTLLG